MKEPINIQLTHDDIVELRLLRDRALVESRETTPNQRGFNDDRRLTDRARSAIGQLATIENILKQVKL